MPPQRTHVLHCPECGSRTFEIDDPASENPIVHCAECGAEAGQLDEVLVAVKARVARQERERRKLRCH